MLLKIEWVFEDELVCEPHEYSTSYESSRVVDGVRMFPTVVVDGNRHLLVNGLTQHAWSKSMTGDTLLCKCGAWK